MQNRHCILHTVTIVNLVVIVPSTTCHPWHHFFHSRVTQLHCIAASVNQLGLVTWKNTLRWLLFRVRLNKHAAYFACTKRWTFEDTVFSSNEFRNWSGIAQGNLRKKTWVQKSFCEAFLPKGIWFSTNQGWIRAILFLFRTALQPETPIHCTLPATAAPFSPRPSKDGKALPKM